MEDSLARHVRQRANGACEYCRMPEAYYPTMPFPIDHITARQHGGSTTARNLALACLHCNSHKGPNLAGLNPVTRKLTKLFNPRRHEWDKHFRWEGPYLRGRSPIGRVTVAVLAMNDDELVRVRQALIAEGLFPPSR
jgi:hypothetical protein